MRIALGMTRWQDSCSTRALEGRICVKRHTGISRCLASLTPASPAIFFALRFLSLLFSEQFSTINNIVLTITTALYAGSVYHVLR